MFQLFLEILAKGTIKDKSTQHLVMDAILTSTRSEEHVKLAMNWFDTGFMHDISGNKLENLEVSLKHKHTIVQRIWSSLTQTLETKEAYMQKLEKIDNSDWLKNTKKVCVAAHPENKQKMWALYFTKDKEAEIEKWGLYDFQNSFRGWNQVGHRQFTADLQAEFFDKIGDIVASKGRYVAESYFYILRPMNDCDDATVAKYRQLLEKVQKEDPDNTMFIKMLKGTLTDLDVMKRGREASLKFMNA